MPSRRKPQDERIVDYFSTSLVQRRQHDNDLFSYEIEPGRIHSRVYISQEEHSIAYELEEPFLNEVMVKILPGLKEKMIRAITGSSLSRTTPPDIRDFINETLDYSSLEEQGKKIAYYYLIRDFLGYDRIDGLLRDPNIEDITCDGSTVPVFVYHTSYGYIPTNIRFRNDDGLNTFIKKLVQKTGKNITISSPLIDSVLPDGSRIQASLGKYVTTGGPSFTIRKFRHVPMSPVDLIANRTASAEIFSYLWILTEYGSNVMITGGTATGKTTFLNAILLFVPPEKKVVSIEDTNEINLYHENWLSTVTRTGFGPAGDEGRAGEVDMFDLLVASLRHRPDYVVIGEVRGRETFTVFQAMSVGRYSYCTFHADSVDTLVHRLESKPINVPRNLISSLDTIIVLSTIEREGVPGRIASTVSEVNGVDQPGGEIIINRLYNWNSDSADYDSSEFSYVLERISDRTGQSTAVLAEEHRLRTKLLKSLVKSGTARFDEVAAVVRRYHRDKASVLEEFSIS